MSLCNFLDNLEFSHCVLALFYNNFLVQQIFLSHQRSQLLELALVLLFLTIWISDCLCLYHTIEIRMNSLSVFFSRRKFIVLFFKEAVRIWNLSNFLNSLSCSYCVLAVFCNIFFFQEANFSPINEGSCWSLPLCFFSWPFGFHIVYVLLI